MASHCIAQAGPKLLASSSLPTSASQSAGMSHHTWPLQIFFCHIFCFFPSTFILTCRVHVQDVQICYTGIHVPWWFAAPINLSSTLGICSNAIPPSSPKRSQCVMFPSLCTCVLVVQLPLMNESMWCLVFYSCVSLLRMMVYSFIHVPAKKMNSSFFYGYMVFHGVHVPHILYLVYH